RSTGLCGPPRARIRDGGAVRRHRTPLARERRFADAAAQPILPSRRCDRRLRRSVRAGLRQNNVMRRNNMPTLYYAPGACSLAVHITLEWIGAPYEAVKVGYGSPELLAVNPSGAVPTLREDDGWLLTQAGAVLDYLARKHPEAGLAGGDSLREKAEAHKWSSFLTSDMHAAFWPIFMPFRYTTDASDEAKAKVVEAGKALARKQFAILNAHL